MTTNYGLSGYGWITSNSTNAFTGSVPIFGQAEIFPATPMVEYSTFKYYDFVTKDTKWKCAAIIRVDLPALAVESHGDMCVLHLFPA